MPAFNFLGFNDRRLTACFVVSATIFGTGMAALAEESPPANATLTLHGAVINDAPLGWVGLWSGVCQCAEHDVKTGMAPGRLSRSDSVGEPVQVNLELAAYKGQLELRTLSVSSVKAARTPQSEDPPDIEFSHHGTSSRLVVRNGAKVVIRGNARIGGASMSGPGAGIIIQGNAGLESKDSSEVKDSSTHPMNYNDGGIVIGGTASFQGHHFKADDGLSIANTATIKADRVDLDNKTYYPNGKPIYVTGRHDSGYMIAKLGGESMEPFPQDNEQASAIRSLALLSDSRQTLASHTTRTKDGATRHETLVATEDHDGNPSGYQRLISKYTASAAGQEIAIDIQGENLDQNKKLKSSFSISGNLKRR
jgi:hypothetical protein